jgi:hypothetical protein
MAQVESANAGSSMEQDNCQNLSLSYGKLPAVGFPPSNIISTLNSYQEINGLTNNNSH